ncbi:MAG: PilZ domain-containing protein [Candidatus Omnitrophica bacterium]|nr:PilZ domain-containing protein [Candidatus Omnitrophota bacterium]
MDRNESLDITSVNDERRIHPRHHIQERIGSHFLYEIATKVIFQKFDKWSNQITGTPVNGFIKNMSVEGLCFTTDEMLKIGESLNLNVYLPKDVDQVQMRGEVRWIAPLAFSGDYPKYDIGVKLVTVNDHPVRDTIYFDQQYNLEWSSVLESVFGKYRILMQKEKNPGNNS